MTLNPVSAYLRSGSQLLAPTSITLVVTKLTLCSLAIYACTSLFHAFFVSSLRHIPGPWYTKFTGIVRKYHAWRHKEHHYFIQLFERYGPIVRVGPTKVGVGEITMFRKMMSSHEMPKSQMYTDFSAVGENIFTTRSPEFNKARRRQIGPAFASAYVRKMEPLIMSEGVDQVCQLFDTQICAAKHMGQDRTVTNLYYAFTMMATDVISSLAYGRRFGAVDTLVTKAEASLQLSQQSTPRQSQETKVASEAPLQQSHQSTARPSQDLGVSENHASFESQETSHTVLEYMIGTMMLMGLMAEAPFINALPQRLLPQGIQRLFALRDNFMRFTCTTVGQYRSWMALQRTSGKSEARNDILSAYISAQDPETGATLSDCEIASESTVLLAAGTDTTANIMVNSVRLLLSHPEKYARVRDELRAAFPNGAETITYVTAIEKLPYLSAVIYETLRLRASTSGVWPRDAPRPSGVSIGGHFIPPGTVICGSIGGVHLNPETWPTPKLFVPERFLGAEGELRKRNVVAFSAGVRMCPGRHLAMMELVMTLSTVLLKYDLDLISSPAVPATDYFAKVDEVCHITTTFRHPERDCNFYISRSTC
ncbi:hypothetical protein IWW56_001481 [Coemansia sp. RSA 2131]|nr:hypothetical protein IWW56_001481 [Coemansia sp. RSA 2131]